MSAKRSPRAMPVETIITRFKSRNQQFVKERQKKVTKPISPKSIRISKPVKQCTRKPKEMKSSKNDQKTSVKLNSIDSREFYPDKPKRNIEYKKVVLMPKHCMKMIGGTKSCNKRKLHMPRKEIKRTRRDSNSSMLSDMEPPRSPKNKEQDEELTIKDMVLLIEEQGGLNDEDLLEILTCPSPVWWEDPPDGYIEEPIFARPKPAEQKSVKKQLLEEENKEAERRKLRDEESTLKGKDTENIDVSKLGISVRNRGINFMNKRCKLESLLGSIRNKVKGGDDGLKKGNENATDVLNASNNGKDSNLKSQSTVSIQKKIKDTVTDESNTKSTEKYVKQADHDTNKNQRVELNYIDAEKGLKNVENDANNKLNASFKPKRIRNRNRKVENKSKKRIATFKLKEVVTINENLDSSSKNQNVQSTSKSAKNHELIATLNREKRNSESFEDLLDLDDQEILTLENMEIPVANDKLTNSITITNPPIKQNETTCNQLSTTNSSAKINDDNCEKDNSANKLEKSTKTTNCIDNDVTNSKIEQENSENRIQAIDKDTKNKFSYIRVRNIETLTDTNTRCTSDAILGETSSANVKIKKSPASKNYKESRSLMETVNNRLCDNTPVLQEEGCIHTQDDYFNNRKSETKHTSVKIDEFTHNNASIQVENKITEYPYHEGKNVINNARRYSMDSATSDKNMSVEYLDMSLLDEDERKIELESRNNEYNYECDDYESQSDSQSCNKNNHINFKSDLDMTDSNMYDQINESCNSDIIKYIRDNQINMDTIQNEDFNMIDKTLRSSSPIQESAISNKLTPDKENINKDKRTEYVTVYKVINSDSENECYSGKIEVKSNTLNEKKVNISTSNEIREGSLMKNNVIVDSEMFAYEEEYLTEFDEIEIVGNGKGNVIKIGEVGNATLNLCNNLKSKNSNKITEIITENAHHQGSLSKTVEGNKIEVIYDDLSKINNVPVSVEDVFKNQINLSYADSPKVTDKSNKHNYYKYRKDIWKANKNNEIISNNKSKKENHENVVETKKIDCKLCNFKNKFISLSENNNTIKYCLVCSSIYDTENCKYCIKKLKKECSCKNIDLEYVCDKCNLKMGDKEAIIEHLKMNCNMVTHTGP